VKDEKVGNVYPNLHTIMIIFELLVKKIRALIQKITKVGQIILSLIFLYLIPLHRNNPFGWPKF